jgi:hypothetical protein
MRLFEITLTAAIAIVFSAASANALVSVFHTNDTGGATVAQGGTFNVDVVAAYDGLDSSLGGIFVSAGWDPAQLMLIDNTTAPFAIFSGALGSLSKLSDPAVFPGDPAGTIRTVQYGAPPGQAGGPGSFGITTLTFQVIGGVDGVASIDVTQLSGDGNLGGGGSASVSTSVDYVPVPEPGTALLMGLGLAGLGYAGRRNA